MKRREKQYRFLFILTSTEDYHFFKPLISYFKSKFPFSKIVVWDFSKFNRRFYKNNPGVILQIKKEVQFYWMVPINSNPYYIDQIIQSEGFNACFSITDHSMVERGILMLCKRHNAKAVVVINGLISAENPKGGRNLNSISFSYLKSLFNKYKFLYHSIQITKRYNPIKSLSIIINDLIRSTKCYDLRGFYYPDYIFTWGLYDKEIISKRVDPNRTKVYPIGDLKIDSENYFAIDETEKMVLILSSAEVEHGLWTVKMKRKHLAIIFKSLKSMIPKYSIIFRPHPKEDLYIVYKVINELGLNGKIKIDNITPLNLQIAKSQLVITGISTTVINSLAYNKPTVVLDLYNSSQYLGELIKHINLAKSSKELNNFVENFQINQFSVRTHKDEIIQNYIANFEKRDAVEKISSILSLQ